MASTYVPADTDPRAFLRSSYTNQRQLAFRALGPLPCLHGTILHPHEGCTICRASGCVLLP